MRLPSATDPLPSAMAYVALGSNVGDSRATIRRAIQRVQQLSARPLRGSSLWQTSPVDCPPGSPPFINAVVALTPAPGESPESLREKLQGIEIEFGRTPQALRNAPRPLDLDLIAFGQEQRSSPQLTLPHPRTHRRRFVLAPLAEIAPELVLPGQTQPVRQLLEQLESTETVSRVEARRGGESRAKS